MNKRYSLTSGTIYLEAVVRAAAVESAGERVVVDESGGKCGGDDVEGIGGWRIRVSGGVVNVGTEVTEDDMKVTVGVEVGE